MRYSYFNLYTYLLSHFLNELPVVPVRVSVSHMGELRLELAERLDILAVYLWFSSAAT